MASNDNFNTSENLNRLSESFAKNLGYSVEEFANKMKDGSLSVEELTSVFKDVIKDLDIHVKGGLSKFTKALNNDCIDSLNAFSKIFKSLKVAFDNPDIILCLNNFVTKGNHLADITVKASKALNKVEESATTINSALKIFHTQVRNAGASLGVSLTTRSGYTGFVKKGPGRPRNVKYPLTVTKQGPQLGTLLDYEPPIHFSKSRALVPLTLNSYEQQMAEWRQRSLSQALGSNINTQHLGAPFYYNINKANKYNIPTAKNKIGYDISTYKSNLAGPMPEVKATIDPKVVNSFLRRLFRGLAKLPIFKVVSKATSDVLRLMLLKYASDKDNPKFLRQLAMWAVALKGPESATQLGGNLLNFTGGALRDYLIFKLLTKGGKNAGSATKTALNLGSKAKFLLPFLGKFAPAGLSMLADYGISKSKFNNTGWGTAGRILGYTAGFAGTGALLGGPIGAGIGAILGLITGIVRSVREHKKVSEDIRDDVKDIRKETLWDRIKGALTGGGSNSGSGSTSLTPNAIKAEHINYKLSDLTFAKPIYTSGMEREDALKYVKEHPEYFAKLKNTQYIKTGGFVNDIPYANKTFADLYYKQATQFAKAYGANIMISGALSTRGSSHAVGAYSHATGFGIDASVLKDGKVNEELTKQFAQYMSNMGFKGEGYEAPGTYNNTHGIVDTKLDKGTVEEINKVMKQGTTAGKTYLDDLTSDAFESLNASTKRLLMGL